MMEKDLIKNIINKNKYLYFSMNSSCLKHFSDNVISIPRDGSDMERMVKEHISYLVVLNSNLVMLSTFENSGYFDEKYDVTFGFGTNFILNSDYFVFNRNALKSEDIRDVEILMRKIIRRKGKFDYDCDILMEKLDLNKAAGILYYTKDAKKNIKDAKINKKIIQFDLIDSRNSSLDAYRDFDKKMAGGSMKEYDWNKNEFYF